MRAVVQRVSRASVKVDGKTVGKIDSGLLVFVAVEKGDTEIDTSYMAGKVAGLRIFYDEAGQAGKMNLSVGEAGGSVLCVSQFTLMGDVRKGRRPAFTMAEAPELAEKLYLCFVEDIMATGLHVEEGVFRAHMEVSLVNDGPVTILLDSRKVF